MPCYSSVIFHSSCIVLLTSHGYINKHLLSAIIFSCFPFGLYIYWRGGNLNCMYNGVLTYLVHITSNTLKSGTMFLSVELSNMCSSPSFSVSTFVFKSVYIWLCSNSIIYISDCRKFKDTVGLSSSFSSKLTVGTIYAIHIHLIL